MTPHGILKLRFRDGTIEQVHGITPEGASDLLNRLRGSTPPGWVTVKPMLIVDTAELVMAGFSPSPAGAA